MSFAAFQRAKQVPRRNPQVRGPRQTVLLLLADYASDDGIAWPSTGTLALDAGLSWRAVHDALSDLERMGLISGTREVGRVTRWRLHLDFEAARAPGEATGCHDAAPLREAQRYPCTPLRGTPARGAKTPAPGADRTTNNYQDNNQGNGSTPFPSLGSGKGSATSPVGDAPSLPFGEPANDPPRHAVRTAARAKPEVPDQTLWDMAAVWNEHAAEHGLAQVSELTDRRKQQLRARIAERWKEDPVRTFRAYVRRICSSPFLRGEGSRGWKASFDWALKPGNIVKVAEGEYHDGEAG